MNWSGCKVARRSGQTAESAEVLATDRNFPDRCENITKSGDISTPAGISRVWVKYHQSWRQIDTCWGFPNTCDNNPPTIRHGHCFTAGKLGWSWGYRPITGLLCLHASSTSATAREFMTKCVAHDAGFSHSGLGITGLVVSGLAHLHSGAQRPDYRIAWWMPA